LKKLLVLSDSHGSHSAMLEIVQKEKPDIIYHLGDHIRDSEWLKEQVFHIPVIGVVGNCDYRAPGLNRILDEIEGVRIFGCHGHQYHVKYSLMSLRYAAMEVRAALCLFGHTHEPVCLELEELTMMNPGSCGGSAPSYGVVLLEEGKIQCSLKRL